VLLGLGCWLLVRDRVDESAGAAPKAKVDRTVVLSGLLSVVRNRASWPATMVNFGIAGSFFAFAGLWATPYLVQVHGMSRAVASGHVSLFFAGFAIGCLLIGGLSDRLRRRKPVIIVTSHLYGLLWLLWLAAPPLSPTASYTLFTVMGLVTASFTLTWACAKEVNPPQLSGMATSVTNMGGFLSGALLQPLAGWMMDWRWSGAMANGVRFYSADEWRWGLALLAAAAWFGAISAWRLKETGCRNIWKEPA
jgi:sugar phosphate permease